MEATVMGQRKIHGYVVAVFGLPDGSVSVEAGIEVREQLEDMDLGEFLHQPVTADTGAAILARVHQHLDGKVQRGEWSP